MQTPKQRKANEAFAKKESSKRGKPTSALKKAGVKRTTSQKATIGEYQLLMANDRSDRILNFRWSSIPVLTDICIGNLTSIDSH